LKPHAEPAGSGHRHAFLAGALALVSLALLGIAARAHASETVYWDNYNAGSVAFANIDGSGGGELKSEEIEISEPEGMAFDPVNGRIYIASHGNGQIDWVGIHGGSGVLDTTGAPVEQPQGIAVDPATQTVYWGNAGNALEPIGYANANDSGVAGALNVSGASEGYPGRIALDPTDGRVYWISGNALDEDHLSYANLNNTGGGDVAVSEEELPESFTGLNVDPATQRLYILAEENFENEAGSMESASFVYWINLSGVGGGEVDTTNASFDGPFGMAFDPSLGRFYWANYDVGPAEPAIGTATLAPGGGGGISIATAPVAGPQDPVVLKSPTAVAAPVVSASGTTLSCSQGTWSQDYVGSYVYGAPESYAYQWAKDGQAISGATASTLDATASGSYTCTVTATNQFGSGSQASSGTTVTIPTPASASPAALSLKLASKKAVKVKAGKVAVIGVDVVNAGGTASVSVKVCAQLTKKAKKGLVAPKCVAPGSVPAGKSVVAKLRVKTHGSARGLYKFTVTATGAKAIPARVKVIPPQAKKHKK
jgi:hypothetical protein